MSAPVAGRAAGGQRVRSWAPSAVMVAWLTVVWVLLWGQVTLANLLGGLAVAGVLVGVFPVIRTDESPVRLRPLAMVRFVAWFGLKLLEANLGVAAEVLRPRSRARIRTGIVAVPVRGVTDRLVTLVANAISLTPGTLTVEVRAEPTTLYVHVMRLSDVDAIRVEILDLERRAILAFGSPEALATLDEPRRGHSGVPQRRGEAP